jgi:hypothetical protein
METARLDTSIDDTRGEACDQQLLAADDPVLAGRQAGESALIARCGRSTTTVVN